MSTYYIKRFSIKDTQVRLALLLIGLLAANYYAVDRGARNLITGTLFLASMSVGLWLIAEAVTHIFKCSQSTTVKIGLSLITLCVMLIVLEFFLRFGVDKYSTYPERNGSHMYVSVYQHYGSSWFRVYPGDQHIKKREFTHIRKVNSLGLPEEEIPVERSSDDYRVLALGDSFTEGIGTSHDSTWVRVMERELDSHLSDRKIKAINAGVSGSDVFFEYMLLKGRMLAFKPDLVIVVINHSDVFDIITRGGIERFQPDGSLMTPKGPWWEWLYASSYVVRHIAHDILRYNWLLLRGTGIAAAEKQAIGKIRSAIDAFVSLAAERDFRLLFVFHPLQHEVQNERYDSPFHDLVSEIQLPSGIESIDLLKYYQANKLISEENSVEFYWQLDLHHNTKGYEVMGKAIANKVIQSQLLGTSADRVSASREPAVLIQVEETLSKQARQ